MMNHLLLWLSARGEGPLASLRREIARFGGAASDASQRHYGVWDLVRLGHIEVGDAAPGAGWRICPPTLALRAGGSYSSGILCGARTPHVLAALEAVAGAAGGRVQSTAQANAPDLIEVAAPDESSLSAAARRAGIAVQPRAASSLLAAASPVADVALQAADYPIGRGWEVTRFSRSKLRWVSSSMDDLVRYPTALFGFKSDFQRLFILRNPEGTWSCEPGVGRYRVLGRRHHAIRYSAVSREFRAASGIRPPGLIERALVVASGRLPKLDGAYLAYPEIDIADARTAATRLGQTI